MTRILNQAQEVTADDDGPIYGRPRPTWDLSPLLDVCGDFRETLQKSKEVLERHISSSRDRGVLSPIVNIRWNMTVGFPSFIPLIVYTFNLTNDRSVPLWSVLGRGSQYTTER